MENITNGLDELFKDDEKECVFHDASLNEFVMPPPHTKSNSVTMKFTLNNSEFWSIIYYKE